MLLQEILQRKGTKVYQISASATLADVVDRLVDYNVGSLIVIEADRVVGIITERDILKASAANDHRLAKLLVRDYMSRNLVTACPLDDVENVMGLMTNRRIRHLPVFDREQLIGMISIGDVVKAQFDNMAVENHYLKAYIQS